MCLQLKLGSKKQIATEDIVVYKHLTRTYDNSNTNLNDGTNYYGMSETKFKTPFRNEKVELGKTYESALKADFEFDFLLIKRNCNEGLHSFKYNDIRMGCWSDVVCKCIIPKGSSYYLGHFWDDESYASDKLTYVEIISKKF